MESQHIVVATSGAPFLGSRLADMLYSDAAKAVIKEDASPGPRYINDRVLLILCSVTIKVSRRTILELYQRHRWHDHPERDQGQAIGEALRYLQKKDMARFESGLPGH